MGRALSFLFDALVLFLIVRTIFRLLAGPRPRPAARQAGGPVQQERAGGNLVRDPQCGTYVPESRAIRAGELYFCSTTCRDAYTTHK